MKYKPLLNLIGLAAIVLASAQAGYGGHVIKHVSLPKNIRYEVRTEEVALRGESGQIGRQLLTAELHLGSSAQGDSGQIG